MTGENASTAVSSRVGKRTIAVRTPASAKVGSTGSVSPLRYSL